MSAAPGSITSEADCGGRLRAPHEINMSKSKKSATAGTSSSKRTGSEESARPAPRGTSVQATRETVESIAVAVILAFLFRAFVAEAFVIPTGSMAPTLMGQHKDVECPECGYWYQTGASIEIEDRTNPQQMLEMGGAPSRSVVVGATCPLCRYQQLLDLEGDANKATFSGDRILVSKFIYDFSSPERWDVIVFKYPFNAKQNFIKRLIGLPGESILIKRGNIYVKSSGSESFEIARKPDRKLLAMLQVVDDSKYIARSLIDVNWPHRWRPWVAGSGGADDLWTTEDHGHSYQTTTAAADDVWLRYHHIIPSARDWTLVRELREAGQQLEPPDDRYLGSLIRDFYAYNAFLAIDQFNMRMFDPLGTPEDLPPVRFGSRTLRHFGTLGLHWVGDLAFEGDVEVQTDQGELLLLLVKGGVSYVCRIDIATGEATLSIDEGRGQFRSKDGRTATSPRGQTQLKGAGTYSIRYSNVDAEIRLWVEGDRIDFDGPTTYPPEDDLRPVATAANPGDLAPVGIGANGASLHVHRLRVLRDVYYVATQGNGPPHEYQLPLEPQRILEILDDPAVWDETQLFDSRDTLEFDLGPDEFFPLGDNSPQSSDARMWPKNSFERDLLIGRALLIYWPHPWYRPIPYLPNFKRMRLIH